MEINTSHNVDDQSPPNIHVAELNWGEALPAIIPIEETSLILAADCVYFEVSSCTRRRAIRGERLTRFQPAFPPLIKTLCDLAPLSKNIEFLFCWKKRRKVRLV